MSSYARSNTSTPGSKYMNNLKNKSNTTNVSLSPSTRDEESDDLLESGVPVRFASRLRNNNSKSPASFFYTSSSVPCRRLTSKQWFALLGIFAFLIAISLYAHDKHYFSQLGSSDISLMQNHGRGGTNAEESTDAHGGAHTMHSSGTCFPDVSLAPIGCPTALILNKDCTQNGTVTDPREPVEDSRVKTHSPNTFAFQDPLYQPFSGSLPLSFCLTLNEYLQDKIRHRAGAARSTVQHRPAQPDSLLLIEFLIMMDLGIGIGDTRLFRTMARAMCGHRIVVGSIGGISSAYATYAQHIKGEVFAKLISEWFNQAFPASQTFGYSAQFVNEALHGSSSQTSSFCYSTFFENSAVSIGREEIQRDIRMKYDPTEVPIAPPLARLGWTAEKLANQRRMHWPDLVIMDYSDDKLVTDTQDLSIPRSMSYRYRREAAVYRRSYAGGSCYAPQDHMHDVYAPTVKETDRQDEGLPDFFDFEKIYSDEPNLGQKVFRARLAKLEKQEHRLETKHIPIYMESIIRNVFSTSPNSALFGTLLAKMPYLRTNHSRQAFMQTNERNFYESFNYYSIPHWSLFDQLKSSEEPRERYTNWDPFQTLKSLDSFRRISFDGVHLTKAGHAIVSKYVRTSLENTLRELQTFIHSLTARSYRLFRADEFDSVVGLVNNDHTTTPLQAYTRKMLLHKDHTLLQEDVVSGRFVPMKPEEASTVHALAEFTFQARSCLLDSLQSHLPSPIFPVNYQHSYRCAGCWHGTYKDEEQNNCRDIPSFTPLEYDNQEKQLLEKREDIGWKFMDIASTTAGTDTLPAQAISPVGTVPLPPPIPPQHAWVCQDSSSRASFPIRPGLEPNAIVQVGTLHDKLEPTSMEVLVTGRVFVRFFHGEACDPHRPTKQNTKRTQALTELLSGEVHGYGAHWYLRRVHLSRRNYDNELQRLGKAAVDTFKAAKINLRHWPTSTSLFDFSEQHKSMLWSFDGIALSDLHFHRNHWDLSESGINYFTVPLLNTTQIATNIFKRLKRFTKSKHIPRAEIIASNSPDSVNVNSPHRRLLQYHGLDPSRINPVTSGAHERPLDAENAREATLNPWGTDHVHFIDEKLAEDPLGFSGWDDANEPSEAPPTEAEIQEGKAYRLQDQDRALCIAFALGKQRLNIRPANSTSEQKSKLSVLGFAYSSTRTPHAKVRV